MEPEGAPPEGAPPSSRKVAGGQPRRKKRSSKASPRPRPAERVQPEFSLDVSLPEGRAAAWETIEETDIVARDAGSQRRKDRARRARSLSERDQRDLDNVIGLLAHHGSAIERALDTSTSLESRVQRLETWQTEQIEAEIEDRLEALSSASASPRDDHRGSAAAVDDVGVSLCPANGQSWQVAFHDVNTRMGKLTEAFGSYTKNSTRIERLEALVDGLHDPALLDGSIDRIASRLGVVEMQLKQSEKQPPGSPKGSSRKGFGMDMIGVLSARVDALERLGAGDGSSSSSSRSSSRNEPAASVGHESTRERLEERLDVIAADVARLCSVEEGLGELDSRVTASTAAIEARMSELSAPCAGSTSSAEDAPVPNASIQALEAQLVDLTERMSALSEAAQAQLPQNDRGPSADELQAQLSAEVASLREELSDLRDETTDLREQLAEVGDSVSADGPGNRNALLAHAPERPAGRRYSVSLASGAVDDFVAVLEVPSEATEDGDTQEEVAADSMRVICPEGVAAGDALYIQTPEGHEITTTVPEGVEPGDEFDVSLAQDSESVGHRDQEASADGTAESEAGGEAESHSDLVGRSEVLVWMEQHATSVDELQRRVDALDGRLTSSESALDIRLSEMSGVLAEADVDDRAKAPQDSELTRTVASLVESQQAAAVQAEDFRGRFDALKVWAESSSSSLHSELESLRSEAAAEAAQRSLLAAEFERVTQFTQEVSHATADDLAVGSVSTGELAQRIDEQDATMASLNELFRESTATLEEDRKLISVIEQSMGTLDARLAASTSGLEVRVEDIDARLRELKHWAEVNSRELSAEVRSVKGASSVTDLRSQHSEPMEVAQEQSDAMEAAIARLRADFDNAVSDQAGPRSDDPELTEWMTTTTTKVAALETGLHENVVTLEREFKQFGQALSELSQWMQDHTTNGKARLAELDTRVTQLLEAAQQEGTSSSKADGDDENMMAMVDLRIETKASSLEDQIRTLGELCEQSRRAFAEETLKQADSEVTSYAPVGQVDELRARLDALQVGQPYPTIEMDPFFFLIV